MRSIRDQMVCEIDSMRDNGDGSGSPYEPRLRKPRPGHASWYLMPGTSGLLGARQQLDFMI